jgi:RNA recognition motif-containing protein
MAPAQTKKAQAGEKKRVSKAVKRKAKKEVEAPSSEEADEKPEAKPIPEEAAEAAGAKAAAVAEKSKPKKTKANRLEEMAAKAEKEPKEPRGVIYVGHIPEGFAEPQMKKFFGQFGRVTRLRISRSKKTARSKGYAFVEFDEESVAEIVAKTMQGYLLFDKTLVCHMLEKEKQHPMLFKGCRGKIINTQNKRRKKFAETYNDRPTVEVDGQKVPRHTLRQADRRKKSDKKLTSILKELGVDYDVSGADEGRGAKSPKAPPKVSPKLPPKSSPKAAPAAKAPPAGAGSKKKKRKTT